jgi:hypothetical protein
MTTTRDDLLLAILAMDSYNQGYDKGLGHGKTRIGSAEFKFNSATAPNSEEVRSGFYAAAYQMGGRTVISYRGTDNLRLLDAASDIFNGWVIGAGTQTGQSAMALEFYRYITGKSVFDGKIDSVTLTGHSLGGEPAKRRQRNRRPRTENHPDIAASIRTIMASRVSS